MKRGLSQYLYQENLKKEISSIDKHEHSKHEIAGEKEDELYWTFPSKRWRTAIIDGIKKALKDRSLKEGWDDFKKSIETRKVFSDLKTFTNNLHNFKVSNELRLGYLFNQPPPHAPGTLNDLGISPLMPIAELSKLNGFSLSSLSAVSSLRGILLQQKD